jgi:hypothetical protein
MLAIQSTKNQFSAQVFVHLLTSAIPVLFFFYIDEGYYSFAWMREPGAWLIFMFYTLIYTGIQLLIKILLPKKLSSWNRTTISCILGSVWLTIFFWYLFSK